MAGIAEIRTEILEANIEKTLFKLSWPLILNNLVFDL